jgi:predicted nucleic acid-binding protein
MILIADASALIALSACDSLWLLDAIFGTVLVPEAVFSEVAAVSKPHSEPLQSYLHGKVRQVDMRHFVFLDAYADAGETAAMQLHKELDAH